MAGIDYRQLQGPEQVNTNLPDDGAAARAAALERTFKEFEGVAGKAYESIQTERGALAGAAAGATGNPKYREGFAQLTAYGRAFNNAATGAYAVQAEAQADDDAARLRVQANNDPNTFRATYSAVRDGVLKHAPAEAVPMLTDLYNRRLAAGLAAISGDQAAEQRTTQRQIYDEGVARQTSRVAILQGSENPQDQLAALDEQAKLSLLIEGGKNSGLYSAAEAQAMHVGAMRQITSQVFSTTVDRELAKPAETRDIVGLMERFRQAHVVDLQDTSKPPTLSEAEYQKLYADATTKIREQNLLDALDRRETKSAEQIRWEQGDINYTALALSHQATPKMLSDAVRTGDLKPETARSLNYLLEQGNTQVKSDPNALLRVHTRPDFLDLTPDEVTALPGINDADKLKIIQEQEKRRNSWEGTQASKQAVSSIGAALKIPPGTMMAALSEEQRTAYSAAQQEYIQIVNGLKPSEQQNPAALNTAAQTVIQHAQQRNAVAEAAALTRAMDYTHRTHGPGGSDEWDAKKLAAYDEQMSKRIAAAQARAKGP